MIEDRRVLFMLNECVKNNKPVATVAIVKTNGSTPRGVGSTMLVDENGNLLEGTIGGGILEEKGKKDAAKYIKRKETILLNYDLDSSSENKNNLPMICGGNVHVFIKVYNSNENLIIVGAGHVSEKIAELAKTLDYSITVMDDRKGRLNSEIFPGVENLVHGNIIENLKKISIDKNTLIIIVTHGHVYDQEALEIVLRSKASYIGMMGSSNKIKICFQELLKKGYSKEELSKVYTPIGIDIGGETPEEIAMSIMAEIQAIKNKKNVPHLSDSISKFN